MGNEQSRVPEREMLSGSSQQQHPYIMTRHSKKIEASKRHAPVACSAGTESTESRSLGHPAVPPGLITRIGLFSRQYNPNTRSVQSTHTQLITSLGKRSGYQLPPTVVKLSASKRSCGVAATGIFRKYKAAGRRVQCNQDESKEHLHYRKWIGCQRRMSGE